MRNVGPGPISVQRIQLGPPHSSVWMYCCFGPFSGAEAEIWVEGEVCINSSNPSLIMLSYKTLGEVFVNYHQ